MRRLKVTASFTLNPLSADNMMETPRDVSVLYNDPAGGVVFTPGLSHQEGPAWRPEDQSKLEATLSVIRKSEYWLRQILTNLLKPSTSAQTAVCVEDEQKLWILEDKVQKKHLFIETLQPGINHQLNVVLVPPTDEKVEVFLPFCEQAHHRGHHLLVVIVLLVVVDGLEEQRQLAGLQSLLHARDVGGEGVTLGWRTCTVKRRAASHHQASLNTPLLILQSIINTSPMTTEEPDLMSHSQFYCPPVWT